jgi:hypothetical protein
MALVEIQTDVLAYLVINTETGRVEHVKVNMESFEHKSEYGAWNADKDYEALDEGDPLYERAKAVVADQGNLELPDTRYWEGFV